MIIFDKYPVNKKVKLHFQIYLFCEIYFQKRDLREEIKEMFIEISA